MTISSIDDTCGAAAVAGRSSLRAALRIIVASTSCSHFGALQLSQQLLPRHGKAQTTIRYHGSWHQNWSDIQWPKVGDDNDDCEISVLAAATALNGVRKLGLGQLLGGKLVRGRRNRGSGNQEEARPHWLRPPRSKSTLDCPLATSRLLPIAHCLAYRLLLICPSLHLSQSKKTN